MSTEGFVEKIIQQALDIGQAKATEAAGYASNAITAASGAISTTRPVVNFSPKAIEPNVFIPYKADGNDSALYNSLSDRIVGDLAGRFALFFGRYFPDSCDSLSKAQHWLCRVLTEGGTGIRPEVEDQIWQRDRARILADAARVDEETVSGFAARGFPIPPGAALFQRAMNQYAAQSQIAQASRDTAIKQLEIEVETVKFAVSQALEYRVRGIAAACDYIKALALGPEIASKLSLSENDAQAKLINAASQYYDARIRLEQMKLDVHKTNALLASDDNKVFMQEYSRRVQARAQAAMGAAQAAGTQAAAALNAVHASAQTVVQEEKA